MAGNPSEEETKFWVKIGLYLFGLGLGLSARLAELLKEDGAGWKDVVITVTRSGAIAFVVWFLLNQAGWNKIGIVASVMCGVKGKEILSIITKWYTSTLKALLGGPK